MSVEPFKLAVDCSDEETSTTIVELITSTINDSTFHPDLEQIHHAILERGLGSILDPLDIIPLLLPRRDAAAHDILALVGRRSNAKEVIIATQAAIERLESIDLDDDDDDEQKKDTTPLNQLVTLLSLYSFSIPRLKLRKPPSETLHPLLSQLESTMQTLCMHPPQDEGREVISGVSYLVQAVFPWVKTNVDTEGAEVLGCRDMLYHLLSATLTLCASCINSSLAQRTFEDCFPRLTIRSAVSAQWKQGEQPISDAFDAFSIMGFTLDYAISQPSTASLILLSHSPSPLPAPHTLLSALLQPVLLSLESGTALDEALAILLRSLTDANSHRPKPELAEDVITSLFTVLPLLASAHPDSKTRHQSFRVISLLLSLAPPPVRLQLLANLASPSHPPQMCAAAVSLIREAILEALAEDTAPESSSSNRSKKDIFASRLLLRTLGPVLFQPRPSDLFSSMPSASELDDSQESRRIVDCLSLYYLLFMRDKQNLTGIRDADMRSSIEKSLLAPLRSYLMTNPEGTSTAGHFGALVSLRIGLERVDVALKEHGVRT